MQCSLGGHGHRSRLGFHFEFYPFSIVLFPQSTKGNCLWVSDSLYAPTELGRKEQVQWQTKQAALASQRTPCPEEVPPLGLRGGVCASLPRDDSDAEDDWLTPKVMSESLSS